MTQKPNMIFIFMDDMGWRDLACTGSTFYETPNIDRLCREGMVFSNAYASCPVCSPSRASYLTGQYPARVGITDWIDHTGESHPLRGKVVDAPYLKSLPQGIQTVATTFRDQGYDTYHVGKWHLGTAPNYPEQYGFSCNIGGCDWGHPREGYFSPYGIHTLPDGPDGEYLTDRITDEAISLLQNQAADKPFYLSLCHYAVHTPIDAKQQDIDYFTEKAKRMGLDKQVALVEGEEFHTEDKKGQRLLRRVLQSDPAYAAMIWNLDENIGRLVDALQDSPHADNTMIIFTSDNGGLSSAEGSPTCNLPAREGKGWTTEGGVRVPLFVWYPAKVKAGTLSAEAVTTPDFFPTMVEVAGLCMPTDHICDGRSFYPALQGQAQPSRPIFWHYPHYGNQGGTPGSSVVFEQYKLIEFFEDNHVELYDLHADFSEQVDVSPLFPEKTKELYTLLQAWQQDVTAKFPSR